MKKQLPGWLLIGVLIIASGKIDAQNVYKSPTFGIDGGLLFSTIKGDEMIDTQDKRFMPALNVYGNYYFHERFSVQLQLGFLSKGGRFKGHELVASLDYINLPVFGKVTFSSDPELYLALGPYVSYLLQAKTKGEFNDLSTSENVDEDILPNLNKIDYGAAAFAGVQGRFNSHLDIYLQLSFQYGFAPLDNYEGEYRYNLEKVTRFTYEVEDPTIRSWMLSTGFIYYLYPR